MEEQKLSILKGVLGRFRKTGSEYLFSCPFCKHHKPKFSVNLNRGAKCWVCDWKSPDLRRVIRRVGSFNQLQEWDTITGRVSLSAFDELFGDYDEIVVEETIELPDSFVSLANGNISLFSLAARRYLKKRGLTEKDLVNWKIGFCASGEYANRVIIPSFNMDGEVNYFIARAYNDDWMRYKNPPVSRDIVFNELFLDWDSDLAIVEGAFDAIVAGPNAVPILGSTLNERSKLFQAIVKHDTPIYIALDPDAEKKSNKLISALMKYDVELYKVDISGYDDVGSMTREEYQKRKGEALFMSSDNYLYYRALSAV
tara:strand:- start:527 stop:1462 length:936 start_codon:yes stop_codon:yes gene_type:complete